jgi:hypothetical protein
MRHLSSERNMSRTVRTQSEWSLPRSLDDRAAEDGPVPDTDDIVVMSTESRIHQSRDGGDAPAHSEPEP